MNKRHVLMRIIRAVPQTCIELYTVDPSYAGVRKVPSYLTESEWRESTMFAELAFSPTTMNEATNSPLLRKLTGSDRTRKAAVCTLDAVFVAPQFRGQGYGLMLYAKAIELATARDMWLTNDFVASTSTAAAKVWRSLTKYVNVHVSGRYANRNRIVYAAKGLNAQGKSLIANVRFTAAPIRNPKSVIYVRRDQRNR